VQYLRAFKYGKIEISWDPEDLISLVKINLILIDIECKFDNGNQSLLTIERKFMSLEAVGRARQQILTLSQQFVQLSKTTVILRGDIQHNLKFNKKVNRSSLDNAWWKCTSSFSKINTGFVTKIWKIFGHPPYSPDLACDFHLFSCA